MGRKTWTPGRHLQTFLTATFGLPARQQLEIVDRIGAAMVEVAPRVREAMEQHPGFTDTGKRMLLAWQEGLSGLRDKRTYAMGAPDLGPAFTGFSDPTPVEGQPRQVMGRSDLLAR